MKAFFTILLLTLIVLSGKLNGQNIKLYAGARGAEVISPGKDTLLNPWCGGWLNPQISNIDLNGDTLQDLFVFEHGFGDDRVLTFINLGSGRYQYAPEYESFFPQLQYWALIVDYNKDGKGDIFTYSAGGGAIDVYENISDKNGLKFKKVTGDYLTYKDDFNSDINIWVPSLNIPAIGDFDGDGDIDIITQEIGQTYLQMYKNMSVEKGYGYDSLSYVISNKCWGNVESAFSVDTPLVTGFGCGKQMKTSLHGATSILVLDMDNDGDLDLLVGNLYDSLEIQYQNGRIVNGKIKSKKDSMISFAPAVLNGTHAKSVGAYPNAYYADGTGDNVNDLIITPFWPDSVAPNHKTLLYRNTGTATGNHFQFVKDNFLQETMVDEGNHASPAFLDFNNDGLMDLVIATRANPDKQYQYDHLVLYKNIGTASKAVYEKVDDDFGSLKKYRLPFLTPAFADIDGDGRTDMFVGRKDGKLMFLKNMADSGGSLKMKFVSDQYQNISTSGWTTPCLAHISSDSVFDLVLGRDSGTFVYYKNTGSKTKPVFNKVTDNFGKVRTNLFYWYYKGPKDSVYTMYPIGCSSPVIADFDHDGKLDMASGSYYGEMFFWFGISDSLTGSFKRTDTVFYNTLKGAKENKLLGYNTLPAAADLNNDNLPEMLIGNYMGGVLFYGSKKMPLPSAVHSAHVLFNTSEFNVYPNPATQSIFVSIKNDQQEKYEFRIENLLGNELYRSILSHDSGLTKIDIAFLKSGIYFVSLRGADGRTGTRKIIVY
jgi:hypothetical protein